MKSERLDYIDTLKFLAIFGILAIHVFALWPDAQILNHSIGSMRQAFRWAVPVFVMISGALLLNREIELEVYFKKRFTRVFYPLIFFIVISFIINGHIEFFTAYWYCWMILGVYLAVPIINKFIQYSDDSEIKYYVIIFIVAALIYQIADKFQIAFALDISFFITPVSYLVLGYYLSRKEFDHSPIITISAALILFIATTIIKYKMGNFMSFYSHDLFYSRMDFGIVQIAQSCSVFVMVKEIYSNRNPGLIRRILQSNIIKRFILSVSMASYGMYLIHFLIIKYIKIYTSSWKLTGTEVCISIAAITVVLFIISWILIWIMSKIPVLNRFSGYA